MKEDMLIKAKLAEKGFMSITEKEFVEKESHDDRIVAIMGKGDERSLFVAGTEMLKESGTTYRTCLDDIPEDNIKFYNQRIPEYELSLDSSHHEELISKHEDKLVREAGIRNKDTRKTKRSVKGLRDL